MEPATMTEPTTGPCTHMPPHSEATRRATHVPPLPCALPDPAAARRAEITKRRADYRAMRRYIARHTTSADR